jgi:hypothetical protein
VGLLRRWLLSLKEDTKLTKKEKSTKGRRRAQREEGMKNG